MALGVHAVLCLAHLCLAAFSPSIWNEEGQPGPTLLQHAVPPAPQPHGYYNKTQMFIHSTVAAVVPLLFMMRNAVMLGQCNKKVHEYVQRDTSFSWFCPFHCGSSSIFPVLIHSCCSVSKAQMQHRCR